mmetsp:Transcript_14468/g.28894  ORF Transcript_14468/g.28894 Transcript_14468/m.28894 type:complete len:224 (-) Transcript_14468:229-900(-)
MRPRTQIPPLIAYVVDRDLLPLRDRVQQLQLVGLVQLQDAPLRLRAIHNLLGDGVVFFDDGLHLLLDRLQILLLERFAAKVKVVEETVIDPRPDRNLGVGPQALDCHRHHVRRRVPDTQQLIGVLVGRKLNLLLLLLRLLLLPALLRHRRRHPQPSAASRKRRAERGGGGGGGSKLHLESRKRPLGSKPEAPNCNRGCTRGERGGQRREHPSRHGGGGHERRR